MKDPEPNPVPDQIAPVVSVLIVSYNGRKHIGACLASVLDQDLPHEQYEVVVADNASSDGTPELIARDFPTVRVVRLDHNHGPNTAVRLVRPSLRGKYIAYANQDAVANRRWLRELLETMVSHPRAGVVEAEGALYESLAAYWCAVAPLLVGDEVDHTTVISTSRAARVAWGRAETAVGRSVIEPRSTRLAPAEGQGLLAAALRLLRATHALRIDAERGATTVTSHDLTELVAAIGASLQHLSDLLSSEETSAGIDLRTLYVAAEASLVAAQAPASIAVHLDEMVNATNTARHLVRSVLSNV